MLVRSEPYCVFPLCSCAVVVHVSSVLGKLRQEDPQEFMARLGLHNEIQASMGYIVRQSENQI